MPNYEYECGSCGGRFEVIQKFSDSVLTVCRLCNKAGKVHKILSPMSFVLKGSGWYATDYPSQDRKAASTPEKPKEEAKPAAAGCSSGACPSKG